MSNEFENSATGRKAARLRAEGKVRKLERADVFVVVGDHDVYMIVLNGSEAFCSCPSTKPDCSHVRAAKHERIAQIDHDRTGGDPFAGLT